MPHLPQMPSPNVHESVRTVEESASTVHVVGARGQIGLFLWPAVLLLPGMAPHIFSLPSFALGRHLTYYPSNNFGIGRGFWTFSFILVDELTTWICVIVFHSKTVSFISLKLPFFLCMVPKRLNSTEKIVSESANAQSSLSSSVLLIMCCKAPI